jgi:hypothetical protein
LKCKIKNKFRIFTVEEILFGNISEKYLKNSVVKYVIFPAWIFHRKKTFLEVRQKVCLLGVGGFPFCPFSRAVFLEALNVGQNGWQCGWGVEKQNGEKKWIE